MAEGTIRHRTVEANGISMHVAESGAEGNPAVVFLHGFPELWYSWRHQMAHLAERGYRCVAPDLRGYGGTDAPPDVAAYSAFHLVGDVVALLDALAIHKVCMYMHIYDLSLRPSVSASIHPSPLSTFLAVSLLLWPDVPCLPSISTSF